MIQSVLVGILFLVALFYIGWLIYKNFTAKTHCDTGCGKCGVDFNQIEKQLQKKL